MDPGELSGGVVLGREIRPRGAPAAAAGVLLLFLLLTGCALTVPQDNPFDAAGGGRQILIEVENRYPQNVSLVAVFTGGRPRLGTVARNAGGTFAIGWNQARELRVEIVPIGASSYTTRAVMARPGDRLRLRIEPTLSRSSLR